MKKIISLLLLSVILLISGCSTTVEEYKYSLVVTDKQFVWLEEPNLMAAEFWEQHNKEFYIVSDESEADIIVNVKELSPDRIGQCYCAFNHCTIELIPSLEDNDPRYVACVIAHEMGHSLGMDHVNVKESLMYPVAATTFDGKCFWSKEDQEELDRQ